MRCFTIGWDHVVHQMHQHRSRFVALAILGMCLIGVTVYGDDEAVTQHVHPYRSPHFILHSDLPPRDARKLLNSMELSLSSMIGYWQRPAPTKIECFVVADPQQWSSDDFPSRQALAVLSKINGFTESREVPGERRRTVHSRVYATTLPGVVQHEITHAYQDQVFGTHDVPLWYKEGMAEVMSYHRPNNRAVGCRPEMVTFLNESRPRRIEKILRNSDFTSHIMKSVTDACRDNGEPVTSQSLDAMWGPTEDEVFRKTRQDYCWAWALCHLMFYHPEYRERFQIFGRSFLNAESDSFVDLFEPVSHQIDFELRQFVSHLKPGYRVDLCAWDWTTPFVPVTAGEKVQCTVDAKRGYQPSGLLVEAGTRYAFKTKGTWTTDGDAPATTADGTDQGAGRLIGVIFDDEQLSSTISLGAAGEFVASDSGKLFVRCQDDWADLADNDGSIVLQIEP